MNVWQENLKTTAESFLTWMKVRRWKRHQKQKMKNPLLDWIEAFLWAAAVVLLVNQYFLQAYQIPSPSMVDTLLVGDRIFVNKFVYGPELLPSIAKIPGLVQPSRGQVIIFENPDYLSKGPVFDLAQRILYMLTLSLVDIDRDEYGEPKAHFLIKRAVALKGDSLKFNTGDGTMAIRPAGSSEFVPEADFQKMTGIEYTLRREFTPRQYAAFNQYGKLRAYQYSKVALTADVDSIGSRYDSIATDAATSRELYAMNPQSARFGQFWKKVERGWYVPESALFPMGDNRDNSKDARYFGPVFFEKVLGQAMIKYWPLDRFGFIE